MTTKHCNTCDNSLPLSFFNKHSKNKDGLHHQCRSCSKKYQREQYKRKMESAPPKQCRVRAESVDLNLSPEQIRDLDWLTVHLEAQGLGSELVENLDMLSYLKNN